MRNTNTALDIRTCICGVHIPYIADCPTYGMSLVGTFSHPLAEPRILAVSRELGERMRT